MIHQTSSPISSHISTVSANMQQRPLQNDSNKGISPEAAAGVSEHAGMPRYSAYAYSPDSVPREIHIVAPPPQFRRFGNAAALGLVTFSLCTIQEAMMQAGMSVGYGHGYRSMAAQSIAVAGITQLFAGLWQIANGDTFEGAAFTSFGAAWLAKGLIDVPGLGILDYQANESPDVVRKQKGIISLTWSIWVLVLLAGNVKSHIANIILFGTLNLQLGLSCAGVWLGREPIIKAGGWFGFFCGLAAMYNAAAILLNEENFWFNLPVGNWYTSRTPVVHHNEQMCDNV